MWTCDTCGKEIKNAEDGWIEWISFKREGNGPHGKGLRLVHHQPASPLNNKKRTGCQYDERAFPDGEGLDDMALKDFLGPDGLMDLLGMIHDQEVPTNEALEMIKRLHIAGYEQARHSIKDAIASGVYEPNTDPAFPSQSSIKAILNYIRRHSAE